MTHPYGDCSKRNTERPGWRSDLPPACRCRTHGQVGAVLCPTHVSRGDSAAAVPAALHRAHSASMRPSGCCASEEVSEPRGGDVCCRCSGDESAQICGGLAFNSCLVHGLRGTAAQPKQCAWPVSGGGCWQPAHQNSMILADNSMWDRLEADHKTVAGSHLTLLSTSFVVCVCSASRTATALP